MTRLSWLLRTTCLVVLFAGTSCRETTHTVGSAADSSAGGVAGGSDGAVGGSGAPGSGGIVGQDASLSLDSATGADSGTLTGSTKDAAMTTSGRSGTTGTGGTGAAGIGGSGGGLVGGSSGPSGGVVGTGGTIVSGGGGGSGGASRPVDAGRACSDPGGDCCFLDEDCSDGFECTAAVCTAERQNPGRCERVASLRRGECWRDSDCPAGSGGCSGAGICPCHTDCSEPDTPGACIGAGATDGSVDLRPDGGMDGAVTACEQRGGTCRSLAADDYDSCPTLSGTQCRLPAPTYEGSLGCAASGDGVRAICCLPIWDQPSSQCTSGGMVCYPTSAAAPGKACPLGWGVSNALCETMPADCCAPPLTPICPPWP